MTCEMATLDKTGDTKTIWDTDDPVQVEAARSTFNTLKGKGYMAFRVEEGGGKGSMLRDFDPRAGKIILAPALAGG